MEPSALRAEEREKKRYDLIQTAVTTLTSLGTAALAAIYAAGDRFHSVPVFAATILYFGVVVLGVMIFHKLHNIVAARGSLDDVHLQNYRIAQFWIFIIATLIIVLFLSGPLFFQGSTPSATPPATPR